VLIAYLLPPIRAQDYDEVFARTIATPLIAASNGANKEMIQQCFDNQLKTTTIVEQFIVTCDQQNNKCSGYVAIDDARGAIIVVFQGTEGFIQLLDQGFSFLTSMTDFVGGGKVISYYHDAFYHVWNAGMETRVRALKNANPTYLLYAIGHSLGGALASVGASHMVSANIFVGSEVRLVTFGQPRTGNQDFSTAMANMIRYRFRIVRNHDIVPHLPPKLFVATANHFGPEVWYANDMTMNQPYKLCTDGEDNACSSGTVGLSTAEHTVYFDTDLTNWVTRACA